MRLFEQITVKLCFKLNLNLIFRYSPENPDLLTTIGLLYMQVHISILVTKLNPSKVNFIMCKNSFY